MALESARKKYLCVWRTTQEKDSLRACSRDRGEGILANCLDIKGPLSLDHRQVLSSQAGRQIHLNRPIFRRGVVKTNVFFYLIYRQFKGFILKREKLPKYVKKRHKLPNLSSIIQNMVVFFLENDIMVVFFCKTILWSFFLENNIMASFL